jgi:phosphoglycolate phosphatase-like HAD superfamily hydrolase
MSTHRSSLAADFRHLKHGFQWDAADAYLFDIDGTLVNCRDSVHFLAFHQAYREVLGAEAKLDGVPLHGNTDVGILRAALEREGWTGAPADSLLSQMVDKMCAEAARNYAQMLPQLCPAICDLVAALRDRGRLLGAASGNLEPIGWLKLEKCGLKSMFAFGSFSWPRESRTEIFRHGVALARQRLGQDASVCVVGDTPADIQAAQAAGISVIALATGIHSFQELRACEPDACFADASHLLAMG